MARDLAGIERRLDEMRTEVRESLNRVYEDANRETEARLLARILGELLVIYVDIAEASAGYVDPEPAGEELRRMSSSIESAWQRYVRGSDHVNEQASYTLRAASFAHLAIDFLMAVGPERRVADERTDYETGSGGPDPDANS